MSMFSESISKKIENIPIEFEQFLKMCEGIDIDFDNCNIKVDEYERSFNSYNENRVEIEINEKNSKDNKVILFSYAKDIDYSDLEDEIGFENDVSKEQFIQNFIQNIRVDDPYYQEVILEYIDKYKCEPTEENVIKALREEAEELYNIQQAKFKEMNDILKNKCDLRIEAGVWTLNMDIIYFKNIIKGGIFIPTGGMVLFEAAVDQNGTINSIKVDRYDSISDIAWICDSDALAIDYKKISSEILASEGVLPLQSEVIDLNLLLKEYNLENLRQNPIGAIYKLKDALLSKVLTNKGIIK